MNKKDFCLKKLGQRGRIVIWQVEGEKIRKDLDEEFTNFGQHYRFKYIPIFEFWIDKEANPDEQRFFIDHLLVEWQAMKKGLSYNKASDLADLQERVERYKAGDIKKVWDRKGEIDFAKIHQKLLKRTTDKLSVWLIDGRLVRSVFHVEFTQGGHDQVYDFVPKGEVWIDNDLIAEERPYVILHELYERGLMATQGLPYKEAHRRSSRLEWHSRYDKQKLQENLKTVGWL